MTTKIKSTSIDSGNTFSFGNVVITGTITANGSAGSPGQVLATDGTKIYWTGDIGGNAGPNIVSVVVATSSYASSGNTTIDSTGGYIYVTGNNFVTGTTAYIGNTVATTVTVTSGTRLNIALPALNPGVYDLEIMKPGGITSKKFSALTYVANYNTHGYVTGGMGTAGGLDMTQLGATASVNYIISSVERITFSNDTSILNMRGPMFSTSLGHAGFGTKDVGYTMFGLYGATSFTGGNKTTFASDTSVVVQRFANPSSLSYMSGGVSGVNYGYAGTGAYQGNVSYTTIYRLVYASDTTTPASRSTITSGSNMGKSIGTTADKNYGYFIGGMNANTSSSASTTTCDRLDIANDSIPTILRGPAPGVFTSHACVFSTYTHLYLMGGYSPAGTTTNAVSHSYRWDLSNDTSSVQTSGAFGSTIGGGGGAQNLSYGYVMGGQGSFQNASGTTTLTRYTFASDSYTQLGSKLNFGRQAPGGNWSGTTTTV